LLFLFSLRLKFIDSRRETCIIRTQALAHGKKHFLLLLRIEKGQLAGKKKESGAFPVFFMRENFEKLDFPCPLHMGSTAGTTVHTGERNDTHGAGQRFLLSKFRFLFPFSFLFLALSGDSSDEEDEEEDF